MRARGLPSCLGQVGQEQETDKDKTDISERARLRCPLSALEPAIPRLRRDSTYAFVVLAFVFTILVAMA